MGYFQIISPGMRYTFGAIIGPALLWLLLGSEILLLLTIRKPSLLDSWKFSPQSCWLITSVKSAASSHPSAKTVKHYSENWEYSEEWWPITPFLSNYSSESKATSLIRSKSRINFNTINIPESSKHFLNNWNNNT